MKRPTLAAILMWFALMPSGGETVAQERPARLVYVPGPELDGPPIRETTQEAAMSCRDLRRAIEGHHRTTSALERRFGELTRQQAASANDLTAQIDNEFRAAVRMSGIAMNHGCDVETLPAR